MDVLLLKEAVSETDALSVAVRLDKDLVAQGKSDEQALERLGRTITEHIAWDEHDGREPLAALPETPEVYAQLFAKSEPWSGKAPDGWDVRIWHGDSPAKWISADKKSTLPFECEEPMKSNRNPHPPVILPWPEGYSPLKGAPAVCLVAGQARGHYCFLQSLKG